jgi:hypothetical protein
MSGLSVRSVSRNSRYGSIFTRLSRPFSQPRASCMNHRGRRGFAPEVAMIGRIADHTLNYDPSTLVLGDPMINDITFHMSGYAVLRYASR